MKKFLKALPFAFTPALLALAMNANAQTVQVNGIGSSALFLEAGLGASSTTTGSIHASCVWSGNNSASAGNVVAATDTSSGTSESDAGNAWVAWTTGSGGTCTSPASDAAVYAYLQTDSVVGDRCLFNANNFSPAKCTIAYPTTAVAPAGLILGVANEHALPTSISAALNSATVNAAGTDIRPEDALFATARATNGHGNCGTAIVSGSQYLGLGYNNGDNIVSSFGTAPSVFHAINFTLPTKSGNNYAVTPVGATPILVVVNGQTTRSGFGAHSFSNIQSQTLAELLDGTLSLTGEAGGGSGGNPVTVLLREPLSGTYNTMEYNVPNRLNIPGSGGAPAQFGTSQDVGHNQAAAQQACDTSHNPIMTLNVGTAGGGHRRRAIGTGQELSEVIDATNADVLGYGFWSVANFAGFTSSAAPNARYLTVDGVDPLITTSSNHNGNIPLTGTTDLENVTLSHVADGSYPIWSLLRFVTFGATAPTAVTDLSTAAQEFVSEGTTTSRPDFVTVSNLQVVRSHFVPPAPAVVNPGVSDGQPTPAANGSVGHSGTSACTKPEVGGDVGGVIITLATNETNCAADGGSGTTGERR
jgi:hypothetical protein